ncbi:hypothetical protein AAKU52_003510 [Pedobacter sp. CG_S7]|uniref:hypothetical protein n=1 Tax=Pedobacter sp. CG_S7 TaxID=3143930 RepID=UPI0033976A08
MKTIHYIWLVFPLSIFVAAFMVLQVNIYPARVNQRMVRNATIAKPNADPIKAPNQEQALPYFILAALFSLLVFALPRLQELSISEKSLVLKLVAEVKEEARQLDGELGLTAVESFSKTVKNDKIAGIREKIGLIEEVLKKGK